MLIMLRTITSLFRLKHEAIQEEAQIKSTCVHLSFNRHLTDYVKVLKRIITWSCYNTAGNRGFSDKDQQASLTEGTAETMLGALVLHFWICQTGDAHPPIRGKRYLQERWLDFTSPFETVHYSIHPLIACVKKRQNIRFDI